MKYPPRSVACYTSVSWGPVLDPKVPGPAPPHGRCLCPPEPEGHRPVFECRRFKFPIGFMGLLSGEIPIPLKLLGFCLRLLRPQHRIKHEIKYLHVLSNQEAIKKPGPCIRIFAKLVSAWFPGLNYHTAQPLWVVEKR